MGGLWYSGAAWTVKANPPLGQPIAMEVLFGFEPNPGGRLRFASPAAVGRRLWLRSWADHP